MSILVRLALCIAALAGDGTTPAARAASQTTPAEPWGKGPAGVGQTTTEGQTRPAVVKPSEGGEAYPHAPRPPAWPAVEDLRNWRPMTAHRWQFTDTALHRMVATWRTEVDR